MTVLMHFGMAQSRKHLHTYLRLLNSSKVAKHDLTKKNQTNKKQKKIPKQCSKLKNKSKQSFFYNPSINKHRKCIFVITFKVGNTYLKTESYDKT